MKLALADKPAIPFKVPAGIRLVRIDPKTGTRVGPGDGSRSIQEAFKPGTAPSDNYLVIGVGGEDSGLPQGHFARRRHHHAAGNRQALLRRLPIALCRIRRYIRRSHPVAFSREVGPVRVKKTRQTLKVAVHPQTEETMRAEVERLVEEIKQSVGLLRRHL